MKKIREIRHIEQMILLTKRAKRMHCLTEEDRVKIDEKLKHYQSLLIYMQGI